MTIDDARGFGGNFGKFLILKSPLKTLTVALRSAMSTQEILSEKEERDMIIHKNVKWLQELKFTCSFYQKIAFVYNAFPSSTNKLNFAYLLIVKK